MNVFAIIDFAGQVIDLLGVVILLLGVLLATITFLLDWLYKTSHTIAYKVYRQNLARVILLGLEFLVAGDIIRSVAGKPNFASVGVLAIIVVIRSFLSITFEMEVEGHWPWQKKER